MLLCVGATLHRDQARRHNPKEGPFVERLRASESSQLRSPLGQSLSLSLSSLCSLDISRCICIYNYSIVYLYSIAFLPWQAPMAELTPISSALKAHIVMACSMFTAQVQIPQAKEVAQHYMDFLLPTRRHSGIDAGDPKTCTRRLLY